MKKNLLKSAIIIPALVGLSFTFSTPVSYSSEAPSNDEIKKVVAENSKYDFGTISESGGSVAATFYIINNTDEAILITNAQASCGCTVPNWTKEPIEPGQKGEVKVTYNPKGRVGGFDKAITVVTNTNERIVLRIVGTVEAAQ
jgi:LEA14-like dessication related protein